MNKPNTIPGQMLVFWPNEEPRGMNPACESKGMFLFFQFHHMAIMTKATYRWKFAMITYVIAKDGISRESRRKGRKKQVLKKSITAHRNFDSRISYFRSYMFKGWDKEIPLGILLDLFTYPNPEKTWGSLESDWKAEIYPEVVFVVWVDIILLSMIV